MISLTRWVDLEDGHLYDEGEPYPHNGREVPEDRIKELASSDNKAGYPLIEAEGEPEPVQTEEQPRNGSESRKKAK